MSREELDRVEAEVNAYIRQNSPVETRIMTPDEARELGAQALFGEKYGDEVRVVGMGRKAGSRKGSNNEVYSLELCGGTHVRRTGEIGAFVVLAESASAAGVRRIEALTGEAALDYLSEQDARVAEIAGVLKTQRGEVVDRVKALVDERRALQNEVAELRRQLALGGGGKGGAEAETLGDVSFLGQVLTGVSGKDLRGLIDEQKSRLGSGVVVLIADTGGKAAIAAGVTDDLTARYSAVDLVRAAAEAMGGKGGGGRPDMAQGGGPDASKSEAALKAVRALVEAA
jgi:alanyl-tRNA synthetase